MKSTNFLLRMTLLSALAISMSACGTKTLEVRGASLTDTASRVGVAYRLGFTQFEIKLTRRVVSCAPTLKATVMAEVTRSEVADGAQTYVINGADFGGWTRTSDLQVEMYESGSLKSVNAKSEDHTAEVVSGVIGAAAKVVVMAAAAGAAPGEAAPAVCMPDIAEAVNAVGTAKAAVTAAKANVDRYSQELKRIDAKILLMKDKVDAVTITDQSAIIDKLTAASSLLSVESEALQSALDDVSVVKSVRWPLTSDVFSSSADTADKFSVEQLRKWGSVKNPEAKASELDAYFAMQRVGSYGADPAKIEETKAAALGGSGLKYRIPASGRILVCSGKPCADGGGEIIKQQLPISQLGLVFSLPYKSKALQNTELSATFSESGALLKAGYVQKTAGALKATDSLKGVVDTIADAKKQIDAAPLEKLKAKTALLEQKKKLQDAQAALDVSPTADRAAIVESLEADVAVLDAQTALEAAKTALKEAQEKNQE